MVTIFCAKTTVVFLFNVILGPAVLNSLPLNIVELTIFNLTIPLNPMPLKIKLVEITITLRLIKNYDF